MVKVLEIYIGKSGNIRVPRLKTSLGEVIRPIPKYPPEIECSSQASEEQFKNTFTSTPDLLIIQHVLKVPISNGDSLTDPAAKPEQLLDFRFSNQLWG